MAKYKFDNQKDILYYALQIAEAKVNRYSCGVTTNHQAFIRVTDMLKLLLNDEREHFGVVFLDNQHKFIAHEVLFHGTIDGANVYPREVVKAALKHNAAAVILGHNHPSGICTASDADRTITKILKEALHMVDVRVLDHIIVGGNDHFSFSQNRMI